MGDTQLWISKQSKACSAQNFGLFIWALPHRFFNTNSASFQLYSISKSKNSTFSDIHHSPVVLMFCMEHEFPEIWSISFLPWMNLFGWDTCHSNIIFFCLAGICSGGVTQKSLFEGGRLEELSEDQRCLSTPRMQRAYLCSRQECSW